MTLFELKQNIEDRISLLTEVEGLKRESLSSRDVLKELLIILGFIRELAVNQLEAVDGSEADRG